MVFEENDIALTFVAGCIIGWFMPVDMALIPVTMGFIVCCMTPVVIGFIVD